MMELALRGLQLLSEWTSIVTELYSVTFMNMLFIFLQIFQTLTLVAVETPTSNRPPSEQGLSRRSRRI